MKSIFYKPELDGLRFFAFFLVFVHHHYLFNGKFFFNSIREVGWIGVNLFFILSSYLFTKLLVLEHESFGEISIKKFFIRRIYRIWPVYYIFIIFCSIYTYFQNGIIQKTNFLSLATFMDNIFCIIRNEYNGILFTPHLWTIAYEEQFYILVPFLIPFLIRKNKPINWVWSIMLAMFLSKCIFIYFFKSHYFFWTTILGNFECILLGIILGFNEKKNNLINKTPNFILLSLCFGLMYLINEITLLKEEMGFLRLLRDIFVGAFCYVTLYVSLNYPSMMKFLSSKVFVYFGKRSYGLYLFHFLGIYLADLLMKKGYYILKPGVTSFFLALTFTFIISIFSYRLIEIPFLKLKKKFEMIKSRPV